MNSPLRMALAAIAVIVLAAVGVTLVPRTAGVGGPPATPVPTPTATPITLPLFPQTLTVPEPGVYLAGAPFQIPVTIAVPAGWVGNVGGPYAAYLAKGGADAAGGWLTGAGGAEIAFSLSQRLYADPCHDRGFLVPQPGPTVDDLASALASLPGFDATTPTDVTVDGYQGKQLTLTAPRSFDGCSSSPDGYAIWQLPLGGVFGFTPGQQMAAWILDVNGMRLVITRETQPATSAQDRAEVQAILDSIRIEAPN
jgi:hypothetical protein